MKAISRIIAIVFLLPWFSARSEEIAFSELPPPEVSEKYFRLTTHELIQLAEGGDIEASVDLGWRYFAGDRTDVDNAEARKWFQIAADRGSHRGMTRLAEWYVAANQPKEAIAWHEKAVEQGSTESLVGLGFLHFHGIGFDRDQAKALEYYQKALAEDDPDAHNNMGYFYQHGIQVRQDFNRARIHFEKAAKAGNPSAMNSLGQMYATGQGVEQDYRKAVGYFETGARHGFPGCQANLAMLYLNGLGIPKDRAKGEALLAKAAAQRYRQAARILADIYYQGLLLDRNLPRSLEYYRKAADLGDVDAMLQVAWMLNEGEGIETPDRATAISWLKKAKTLGHLKAEAVLDRLKAHADKPAEQNGADQPATAPESKPAGK